MSEEKILQTLDERQIPYVLYPVAIEVNDQITEDIIFGSKESIEYLEDVKRAMEHYVEWLTYQVNQERAKRMN